MNNLVDLATFPILQQQVNGERLVYLDNAATTQKPQSIIQAMVDYYQIENANIHRGVHQLAMQATNHYEAVRQQVAQFIHAQSASEIIFTSGTTAGLNFLANSLVAPQLTAGDVIVTTVLEHHSNLVPWQVVAQQTGAQLMYVPLLADYTVDLEALNALQSVKAIVIHHVSNVLGVTQPIKKLTEWAKKQNCLVIVDGAQAIAHQAVDVTALGVDAYCFSGHKMYGPTGVGVCYLNKKHHEQCLPFMYGGEMIHQVGDLTSNYKEAPWKFEGGTPPIAQVIGLGQAIQFIDELTLPVIQAHEQHLMTLLVKELSFVKGVTLYNRGENGILSLNIDGIHPHDAATGYDLEGVAVRAGHHCAQPLMRYLQVPATLRMSVAVYNTQADIEQAVIATKKIKEFFNGTD